MNKFMNLLNCTDLTNQNDFTKIVKQLIDDQKHEVLKDNIVGEYLFDELMHRYKIVVQHKGILHDPQQHKKVGVIKKSNNQQQKTKQKMLFLKNTEEVLAARKALLSFMTMMKHK